MSFFFFFFCLIDGASQAEETGQYALERDIYAERLGPVDPGISRGIADLYPLRGYASTHPVIRAIEVSHAVCKAEF